MDTPKKQKISFILYEDQLPPRYFTFSKSLLRLLIYGLPSLTLIFLTVIVIGGVYFQEIQNAAKRKEPSIIKKLKKQNEELASHQKILQEERDALQKKLSEGVPNENGLEFLSLFKQSPGRRDLSSSPETSIEDLTINAVNQKVVIDFKLVNLTKDESRITGYIFIIYEDHGGLQVWPNGGPSDSSMKLAFSRGEFFATSRFRPVQAIFERGKEKRALFKVIIFSNTGDLIYKQIISRDL